jgi:hypothetical protein
VVAGIGDGHLSMTLTYCGTGATRRRASGDNGMPTWSLRDDGILSARDASSGRQLNDVNPVAVRVFVGGTEISLGAWSLRPDGRLHPVPAPQARLGRDVYEVGPENPMRTPPGARTSAMQTPSMILVGGRTASAPAASASS